MFAGHSFHGLEFSLGERTFLKVFGLVIVIKSVGVCLLCGRHRGKSVLIMGESGETLHEQLVHAVWNNDIEGVNLLLKKEVSVDAQKKSFFVSVD